jgi:hypothetical protein
VRNFRRRQKKERAPPETQEQTGSKADSRLHYAQMLSLQEVNEIRAAFPGTLQNKFVLSLTKSARKQLAPHCNIERLFFMIASF